MIIVEESESKYDWPQDGKQVTSGHILQKACGIGEKYDPDSHFSGNKQEDANMTGSRNLVSLGYGCRIAEVHSWN